MGKSDGVPQVQKNRAMFEKLLLDSKAFFGAAQRAWEEAGQLTDEARRANEQLPADTIRLWCATGDDPAVKVEAALTAAAMNCTISIELLLKGFIAVGRRLDEGALAKTKEVNHDLSSAFDSIPQKWGEELEGIFEAAGGEDVEVAVFYNSWNPPKGEWIGDTARLGGDSLRDFLRILNQERMETDRYSFERFADEDFRVKMLSSAKLDEFHSKAAGLLHEKAVECGLARTDEVSVSLSMNAKGERAASPVRVAKLEVSPKLNFHLHQRGAELFQGDED